MLGRNLRRWEATEEIGVYSYQHHLSLAKCGRSRITCFALSHSYVTYCLLPTGTVHTSEAKLGTWHLCRKAGWSDFATADLCRDAAACLQRAGVRPECGLLGHLLQLPAAGPLPPQGFLSEVYVWTYGQGTSSLQQMIYPLRNVLRLLWGVLAHLGYPSTPSTAVGA